MFSIGSFGGLFGDWEGGIIIIIIRRVFEGCTSIVRWWESGIDR